MTGIFFDGANTTIYRKAKKEIIKTVKTLIMKQLLLFLIFFYSYQSFSQLIIDETYKDPSFWMFKRKLENAILKKDTVKLKMLLADKVFESKDVCGYAGCSKDDFIKYYFTEIKEAYKDEIWNDIKKIIRFGFYQATDENLVHPTPHDKVVYIAPSYLKTVNPDDEIVVLSENVNIREFPNLQAKILRKASYEVFKCDCNIITRKESTQQRSDGIDWLEIYLEDGKMGYIAMKYTSYEVTKQLKIAKVNGEWKIIWYYNKPGC